MRIVKAGNPNWNKPWVGKEITCECCECIFMPEANDDVQYESDNRDGNYFIFQCPECNNRIIISSSLFKV